MVCRLKRRLRCEPLPLQEGKRWYLVESGWIKAWLAFTHYNRNTPAPGPIRNEVC